MAKSKPCCSAIAAIASSRAVPASTKLSTASLVSSNKVVLSSTASCTSPISRPRAVATLSIAASNVPPIPNISAIAASIGTNAASSSGCVTNSRPSVMGSTTGSGSGSTGSGSTTGSPMSAGSKPPS